LHTPKLLDVFTPSPSKKYGVYELDDKDMDFGSGGALVVPAQAGLGKRLVTAMGKAGILYVLHRDNLGGIVVCVDSANCQERG
jgi:hypothetical protein